MDKKGLKTMKNKQNSLAEESNKDMEQEVTKKIVYLQILYIIFKD